MQLESEIIFRSTDLPNKCFKHIARFKTEEKFCDVTFTVGAQRISAHRIIVAAAIPFFQDILSTEQDEIMMPDIDPGIFECVVDFAYSCELKITTENVRDLLSCACRFRMEEVQDACCDFLAERLRPENALNFRQTAVELDYPQLIKVIDHYIKERFTEIYQTEEFLGCSFSYIMELIGQDDLQVDKEEKVLEAVLKWVKVSLEDRKNNLPDLLRRVRMTLMTPLYITDIAQSEELIRTSLENRDLTDEAKNYNLFPQRRKDTCSFSVEPRSSMKTSTASRKNISQQTIYTLCRSERFVIRRFDFTYGFDVNSSFAFGVNSSFAFGVNSSFTPSVNVRYVQSYFINHGSTAELNNMLYFFQRGSAWEYDPAKNVSKYLANLEVPRKFSCAASLKNKIYVCGGITGSRKFSNVVECFDPVTGVWTTVSPMRTSRSNLCTVTLGEYLYALGGNGDACVHSSVERYPSVTSTWQTMPPMLSKRYSAGAATLNGRIYVCGGKSDLSGKCTATVEVYDPMENRWEFVSPMNTARWQFILVSHCGKLYALGGKNSEDKNVSTSEVYDPEGKKWTVGPAFQSDYFVSGAVVM